MKVKLVKFKSVYKVVSISGLFTGVIGDEYHCRARIVENGWKLV